MDLKALIAKMDYIESRQILNEGFPTVADAKARADKEKTTGKFDKKELSTGTQYTRKSSTFDDGGKDSDQKKAEKKKKNEDVEFQGSISHMLLKEFGLDELAEKITINPDGTTSGRIAPAPASASAVANPYTGADAAKFAAMSPEDQAWLTKGGRQPDINDEFILARAPNKGKPAPQKVDPNQADRDDAEQGKAMSANAQAAREKEYGDNADRADAELGKAMSTNAQAAREKEYGDNADRADAELGKAMSANAAVTKPTKPSEPTNKPSGDKVGPANPGTKAIQHYLNTKYGQKLAVDGKDGPLTTGAIRSLSGKLSTDDYANIAGLAYAYNVKPGQGPGTVSLGNPEFVKRMTALGYDPKTGDPVGGAKPSAGSGQAASPAASTGIQPGQNARDDLLARQGAKKVNTADTQALENSIKAIEAILAKNKVKSESVEQSAVLENISQFSPREQMEIWKTLNEADLPRLPPGAKFDRDTGNYYTTNAAGGKTYIGGLKPQQSKFAKFASKLGGASGIGKKIAGRAGVSALGGPLAPFLAAGSIAYTAYDVGKALYDTFKDDEIAGMDPADQEAIEKHMAVILQYQKNTDMMANLPPELKTRLENAMKGLNQEAASAKTDTNTDTDTATNVGAGVGAAAAKAKQVAGSAADSAVDASNKFASGVKQGYNQQAASPTKESISQSEDDAILAMIRAVR